MKQAKYILSALIFTAVSTASVQADDSIVNRNVTVEREYKPVIHDAGKINSVPKVLEPKVTKSSATYSDFSLPLNAGYNIHTLPAAELERAKRLSIKDGFARVALGNHFNTLADFAYPILKKSDWLIDASFNHLGTFGTKAHATTQAALSVAKSLNTLDVYGGIGGGHEYVKYYGNNFGNDNKAVDLDKLAQTNGSNIYTEENLVSINRIPNSLTLGQLAADWNSSTFWRFNAFAGVQSAPQSEDLRYRGEIMYKSFYSDNGITERFVHTQGGVSKQQNQNRMGIDADLYNFGYSSTNALLSNFWNIYSVVGLNPYYSIERAAFDVRLGIKTYFSLGHGKAFNPSTDIRAEWRAIPKYLAVYGGITGGYKVNSMDELFSENQYLYPDVRVTDTYSPYEIYTGLKLKPIHNLLLDAYVDYRRFNNQYFFVNKAYSTSAVLPSAPSAYLYSNRFDVLYSQASQLKIGMRANYNYKELLNVELKGAYNGWDVNTEQYAWNKPTVEASLNTDVRLNREWRISANAFYEGGRYAKLANAQALKMHNKLDINLGTSYAYNSQITAFAKINNLINSAYQNFYGYDVQGFNILLGATISF